MYNTAIGKNYFNGLCSQSHEAVNGLALLKCSIIISIPVIDCLVAVKLQKVTSVMKQLYLILMNLEKSFPKDARR